jgi:hypothetical protein
VAAIQLAVAAGATVIATAGTDDKLRAGRAARRQPRAQQPHRRRRRLGAPGHRGREASTWCSTTSAPPCSAVAVRARRRRGASSPAATPRATRPRSPVARVRVPHRASRSSAPTRTARGVRADVGHVLQRRLQLGDRPATSTRLADAAAAQDAAGEQRRLRQGRAAPVMRGRRAAPLPGAQEDPHDGPHRSAVDRLQAAGGGAGVGGIEGYGRYYVLTAALELDVFDALERLGPSTVEDDSPTTRRVGAAPDGRCSTASSPRGLLDQVGTLRAQRHRPPLPGDRRRRRRWPHWSRCRPGPLDNWTTLTDTVRNGAPPTPVEDDPAAFYVPLVEGTFTTMSRLRDPCRPEDPVLGARLAEGARPRRRRCPLVDRRSSPPVPARPRSSTISPA